MKLDKSKIRLCCSICGKDFSPTDRQRWNFAKRKNVVCGEKCRAVISSRTAAHTNTLYASARMTEHNPMYRSESVQKMKRSLRRIGHKPPVRGGNGTGLAPAEKALSKATGLQPHTVHTGMPKGSGYPYHYKIDLADPELKLAVEVDGRSHQALSRQAQDRKKEKFLQAQGWIVLRFTNVQALEETEKCCENIRMIVSTLS